MAGRRSGESGGVRASARHRHLGPAVDRGRFSRGPRAGSTAGLAGDRGEGGARPGHGRATPRAVASRTGATVLMSAGGVVAAAQAERAARAVRHSPRARRSPRTRASLWRKVGVVVRGLRRSAWRRRGSLALGGAAALVVVGAR